MNGGDLRQMLAVGTALLEENVEQVNALNVFPVPDGDTGTNMLLTMQSAMEELAKAGSTDFGQVAHAAAHGSLMGARGNSGVILSQILRGIARSSEGGASLDAVQFASALKEGATTAYRGIGKPVEGTILTVARQAADAGVAAAQQGKGLSEVMRIVVEEAQRSLDETPELLATLKEAGVVDAGGQGYLLILQGAQMSLTGERAVAPGALIRKPLQPVAITSSTDYGYCTEALIRGERLVLDEIQTELERIGTSVIVAGDPDLVHVHVHTHHPGDVLNLATRLGALDRVKIENMQVQHTAFLGSKGVQESRPVSDSVAVATVVSGGGLSRVFRDLGAVAVVPGGQSMNPSIEELIHGAVACNCSGVILLPNNPNVIMTAHQARALAHVDLRVVPTRTVCEGVAAMVAFNPQAGLDRNVAEMTAAAAAIQTIELTWAVRTSRVNGVQIEEGQAIGLLDGKLVHAGDALIDVALRVLEQARVSEHEVVTIYRGEGVSREEGEALSAAAQALWPELQVEVVDGGQPHYPFILSVE